MRRLIHTECPALDAIGLVWRFAATIAERLTVNEFSDYSRRESYLTSLKSAGMWQAEDVNDMLHLPLTVAETVCNMPERCIEFGAFDMTKPRRLYATAIAFVAAALAMTSANTTYASSAPVRTGAPNCAGPASDTWVNVTIGGLRNGNGLIAVTLYPDEPRKFLVKNGSMYVGRVDATAPETRMCLFVPKPGVYGLAVYHDEDSSTTFKRGGMLGLPQEGFGFSNNPPTIASIPSFRSVRLNIAKSGLSTRIQLKYP